MLTLLAMGGVVVGASILYGRRISRVEQRWLQRDVVRSDRRP